MPIIIIFRRFFKIFSQTSAKLLLLAVLALLVFGTVFSYLAEHTVNEGMANLWDTFWWTIVTVATVGYGDKFPITAWGRVVGIICMVGGPVLLASTLGSIGVSWYNNWTKGVRGMSEVKEKNHLVLCGWNSKAATIIEEIRNSGELKNLPVVIIDEKIETKPSDAPDVFFVRGNASEMAVLQRANITEAKFAIVLAENSLPAADQKTVLTVLAVEKSNSRIISSAELNDPNNAEHLKRAGCDIIINSTDITSKLLAMSLLNSSVTAVITDLVSGEGQELYHVPNPQKLSGSRFGDALVKLKNEYDIILIGLERNNESILNPQADFTLQSGDYLLVISEEMPVIN